MIMVMVVVLIVMMIVVVVVVAVHEQNRRAFWEDYRGEERRDSRSLEKEKVDRLLLIRINNRV